MLGESVARLISAAADRPWSVPLAVVLAAALLTLAAVWWAWLSAADRDALDSPQAIARFTAVNLPIVVGIAAASAGLHLAILAAHERGTIGAGPRAALYGGVSLYLLASAILPSRKLTRQARAARLTTSLAAMGLVFMGAIVVPVYLVPALTAVLALGLTAEARLRIKRRRATSARRPATGSKASVIPGTGRHARPRIRNRGPSSRERIMTAVLAPPATTIVTPAGPRWDDPCAGADTGVGVTQAARRAARSATSCPVGPPDLFALTEVILQRSEACRVALSPRNRFGNWPPADVPDWPDEVIGAARQWCPWVEDGSGGDPSPPGPRTESSGPGRDPAQPAGDGTRLASLRGAADPARDRRRGVRRAGHRPGHASSADGCVYRARAPELLARTGSLLRLPAPDCIRVLPKVQTAPNGIGDLSRHHAATLLDKAARWHTRPWPAVRAPRVRFLLGRGRCGYNLSHFRPVAGPLQSLLPIGPASSSSRRQNGSTWTRGPYN